VVLLSPHLDDAVLSAWHVLSSGESVRVVNVFAGIPEPGFVTDLDAAHGARESAAWMRRRRSEDRAALALAGRRPIHLDVLEVQFAAYRVPRLRREIARRPGDFVSLVGDEPGLRTDPGDLAALVAEQVHPDAVVYGPAGVGQHPDHRDLACATTRLAGRVREVRLYADSPYYLLHGGPSWLGERAGTMPDRTADREIDAALSRLWTEPPGLDRRVVFLQPEALDRKWAAIRRYTTEFPLIRADLARAGLEPEVMRCETYWLVAGEAT